MMRGRMVVAAALAATLALGACGDDDDEDAASATTSAASATTDATTETTEDEGSTTSEGTASGGTGGGDGDVCDAADRIRSFDDELNESLSGWQERIAEAAADAAEGAEGGAGLDDVIREFAAEVSDELGGRLPEVQAAYDDLADAVPSELRADVETIRDATDDAVDLLAEVDSLDDLTTLGTSGDLEAAGEASIRVSDYVEEECGFGLTDDNETTPTTVG